MSRFFVYGIVVTALLAVGTPATPQDSGPLDKTAYLTFSAPVQIPGATLDAGRYRFRLTNPASSRNVMQVLSGDGSITYGMFNTTQDHRRVVTLDLVVTFRETAAGVPPAIKSLFYGGEHRGYELVYPQSE
jgi:hypothetical protein